MLYMYSPSAHGGRSSAVVGQVLSKIKIIVHSSQIKLCTSEYYLGPGCFAQQFSFNSFIERETMWGFACLNLPFPRIQIIYIIHYQHGRPSNVTSNRFLAFDKSNRHYLSIPCRLTLNPRSFTKEKPPHNITGLVNLSVPGQNGHHFTDNIFGCIFVNEKFCTSIKISLKFLPKGSIRNNLALVEIMAWRRIGGNPLSEPMLTWFTHIFCTRGDELNIS